MSDAIILSHGAGSNRNSPLLVAVDQAFHRIGVTAVRVDLPFRELRLSGPPRYGDAERDRAGLRDRVTAAGTGSSGRIFLGGHSYGGRQSTILASEFPGLVSGLLLLSYPLHPPRKPQELRTAHFPQLKTKCLFVHGTRDPFGSIDELSAAIAGIPAPSKLVAIEGAGHELSRKGSAMDGVAERIVHEFQVFFNP